MHHLDFLSGERMGETAEGHFSEDRSFHENFMNIYFSVFLSSKWLRMELRYRFEALQNP
jgi:hypothetical protein